MAMGRLNTRRLRLELPELRINHEDNFRVEVEAWETMHLVIPNLYVGSRESSTALPPLQHNNIRNIINVTERLPNVFQGNGIRYLNIRVPGGGSGSLLPYFTPAFGFIEESLEKEEGVLVHGDAGISRSPTLVMAFLMWKEGRSVDDALQFVRSKRSVVEPSVHFQLELQQFAREQATRQVVLSNFIRTGRIIQNHEMQGRVEIIPESVLLL